MYCRGWSVWHCSTYVCWMDMHMCMLDGYIHQRRWSASHWGQLAKGRKGGNLWLLVGWPKVHGLSLFSDLMLGVERGSSWNRGCYCKASLCLSVCRRRGMGRGAQARGRAAGARTHWCATLDWRARCWCGCTWMAGDRYRRTSAHVRSELGQVGRRRSLSGSCPSPHRGCRLSWLCVRGPGSFIRINGPTG